MALIASHLNAEVIQVMTLLQQEYNLPLPPPPYPLPPFSPSLINLMVSVDVKHYVYGGRDIYAWTSGAGAAPLRLVQMMGHHQQKQKQQQ